MKKSDYLKTLSELKEALPSDVASDETPPVETQAQLPLETKVEKPETSQAPAPVVEAPVAATPAAPVTPAEVELFPGYNALPDETKKSIAERWKQAEEAKAARDELERKNREFNMLHQRLAPTQQQLSKQQLEVARLQQQLNEFKANTAKTANSALRQRIDAMKEQFPEDAAMWESTLAEIEAAKTQNSSIDEKLQRLEQREYLNEQKLALTSVHPDWQKMTARVRPDENGNMVVQRTVDTPEAQELEVWANNLDPYERNTIWPLFKSSNAADAIYVLNRFKQDQAIARILAGQTQQGQETAAPPAAQTAPAPAPDPDPSRRTTAQPSRAAGQPMSDKKREVIAAAEFLRKQGKLPPLPQQRRA